MPNSSSIAFEALKESEKTFLQVLVYTLKIVGIWYLLATGLESYFESWANGLDAGDSVVFLIKLNIILVSLCFYVLLVLASIYACLVILGPNRYKTFWNFTVQTTWPYFLESLRALAYILVGFVLFILPGIYFSCRYALVPFIVAIDPEYEKGEIDALEESGRLTSKHIFWFIGIFVLGLLLSLSADFVKPHSQNVLELFAYNLASDIPLLSFTILTFVWYFHFYKIAKQRD